MCSSFLLLVAFSLLPCQAFWLASTLKQSENSKVVWNGSRKQLPVFSTPNDDNHNNNNDSFETMRKVLEASWNTQTMGAVPTNPDVAAAAAGELDGL